MKMNNDAYHTPVLLHNCIEALRIRPDGIYIDATFGGGGHSREILKHLITGRIFAFDADEDAVRNSIDDVRFTLIRKNFSELQNALLTYKVTGIDGLLADLGVSSHQFDSAERGFSTRFDAVLDMRMNKDTGTTAGTILRTYSEENLKKLFREYGELRNAGQIAKKISSARNSIRTVSDLKSVIAGCAGKGKENQFYAKVFQALRIEVNNELSVLKDMLVQGAHILRTGGRMVVISYHSLEDRIVKNFFRTGKFEGDAEKNIYGKVMRPLAPVNKRPVIPGVEEIQKNGRSRSAKLRIAEKV